MSDTGGDELGPVRYREPGCVSAVLARENVWAGPSRFGGSAVRRAGGQLVAQGPIPIQVLGGRPLARTAAVAGKDPVLARGDGRRGDRRNDRRNRREERRPFR